MQNPLIIPIERLHASPLELDLELAPEALDLADPEYTFTAPVGLKAKFEIIGQDVMATGKLHTRAQAACVRCLTPAEVAIDVPLQETWFHATPDEVEEEEATAEHIVLTRTYDGDELDVTEDLRELIMSELPERVFCTDECKGLCPGCGANLNTEKCTCPAEGSDAAKTPEWKNKLKNIKLG